MTSVNNNRIYGLDIFRALAILIVVYGHTRKAAPLLSEQLPAFNFIDGVELFFVLSGFLIGGILIKIVNSEDGLTSKSLLNFWKRRWFRTLPNYYLILVLNVLFVYLGVINGNVEKISYKFIFFLQNFNSGFAGFFWESWSLSIEEWFYIFLPVLMILILRKTKKQKAILITIIILLVLPLLYRYSLSDKLVNNFWFDVSFRKVVLLRIDAIIYGVLAAYIKYYYPKFWKNSRYIQAIFGVIILLSLVYISYDKLGVFSKTLSFSLTSLGAALFLSMADHKQSYSVKWIRNSITHISLISYSMYLINLGLIAQVIDKNFPPQTMIENVISYIIYWVLVISISTVLYNYFEKPIMKFRDKF